MPGSLLNLVRLQQFLGLTLCSGGICNGCTLDVGTRLQIGTAIMGHRTYGVVAIVLPKLNFAKSLENMALL